MSKNSSNTEKNDVHPIKSFIAGGVGGACLVVIGHPPDTIKVSLSICYKKLSIACLSAFTNHARAGKMRKAYLQRSGRLCKKVYKTRGLLRPLFPW